MLNQEDLLNRITKVRNLREECFKYFENSSQEMLAYRLVFSIAKLSYDRMGPVKLGEIAQDIFSVSDKSKQDNIRLTIEKTLMKCGIVEKLRYAPNDVRYILTGYRFQKTKKIESFRGDIGEPVGEVFELPRSTWPIPDEYFVWRAKKEGFVEALKKINSDYDSGGISKGSYEILLHTINENINRLNKKIESKYGDLDDMVGK
ncbi:MAG: hypothetical protein KGL95_09420 [Patescibacteria group bacterium]|nr:hypothetical protein [Patescibacteria group bacterium]